MKAKTKKVKYTDEPLGKPRVVNDFLPPPEDLVFKEENIKVTVEAHVKKPSETVSAAAAIFAGVYNNTANARIGDNATVDVTGLLTVKANSKIPNQIISQTQ